MFQWLVSAAEVALCPWQGAQTRSRSSLNSTHTLGPFHQTSTVSPAISQHPSARSLPLSTPCLSLSLSFPRVQCCEDSRETEPHFPSYFPGKLKWKDTTNLFSLLPHCSPQMLTRDCSTISDLLLGSKNTHTPHSYYWLCLWISTVRGGVEEFNDTQCRFNFSVPQPQLPRCTICPLFKGERGAWVALKPVWLPVTEGVSEAKLHSTTWIWMHIRS